MNILIATKPIQIIIGEQVLSEFYENQLNKIILVENFNITRNLITELKKEWGEVEIIKTKEEALETALKKNKKSNIFVDGDVGFKYYTATKSKKLNNHRIYVYEEGTGTYRTDLVKGKVKSFLFKIAGVGYRFGSCKKTDGIYVYDKFKYKNKVNQKAHSIQIKNQLIEYIKKNKDKYLKYFPLNIEEIKREKIVVYLSNYKIDESIYTKIYKQQKNCEYFIKFHPHLKSTNINTRTEWKKLPTEVPFELIALELETNNKNIVVYSHASSTSYYCKTLDIDFRNAD